MEVAYDTTLVLYPALKRGAVMRVRRCAVRQSSPTEMSRAPRTP